ncbi:tubulin tyrosine ligase-like member 11, putative [Ichthyophthirius multifiliis]|uniref:Tubulin tyrosine ligase-like member 11, putative n=1 Tax=Ichthyophthirius multifiliis TaxID=5932 RepID=G0QNL0_ICHMU|nr:tubulin tyrosine ligase-like member 11, putative [Ichthyophthirius multifiliis]EGR33199.1 tubulin tyrosine ligase-like member 11, putative [Ichthyophthirius multifiliis]|eukprot:XP_004037185.1 tubulin tyrosine ligase-like member 11, putative [Ichthyophthirius multifiliis]
MKVQVDKQQTKDILQIKQTKNSQNYIEYTQENQMKIPQKNQQINGQNEKPKTDKKRKTIKINTSFCRSELKLIRYLIHRNNWKECFGFEGKIMWSGLSINQYDISSVYGSLNVNRIPEIQELAHKKTTGYFLKLFKDYFPDYFDFFPLTFLLPEDFSDLKKYMGSHPKEMFISKPSSGCQGDGIKLIQSVKDVQLQFNYSQQQIIIQQYISNPLIIDKKKFDLRLYVLISSLDPFVVYLHDEGLARFCTEDYQKPQQQNINNFYMHLTNYSLNKQNPNFKVIFFFFFKQFFFFCDLQLPQESDINNINDCSKRCLQSLWKSLEKEGYSKDSILEQIEDLVVKFIISMYPCLLYNYKITFNNKNTKCFHVLGIDILLDRDGKPWFLEANGNPSFNIEHEVLQNDGNKLKEISLLDKYVKSYVVEDVILITNQKLEKQMKIGVGGKFNGFKQLICGDQDIINQMDIFIKMLKIYGKLSGFQFRILTASRFSKLSNFQGMMNQIVTKNDYDIIYKKIMRNQFEQTQMGFFEFVKALEYLTSKLNSNEYQENNKLPAVQKIVNNIISQIQ